MFQLSGSVYGSFINYDPTPYVISVTVISHRLFYFSINYITCCGCEYCGCGCVALTVINFCTYKQTIQNKSTMDNNCDVLVRRNSDSSPFDIAGHKSFKMEQVFQIKVSGLHKWSSVYLLPNTDWSVSIMPPRRDHQHLDAEMQGNMRLFRAQRNFYISGFALFLLVVIRRLVQMITQLATLLAQSEADFRQAQSATVTARTLLDQAGAGDEKRRKEIEELKSQIEALQKDLTREKKDKEAVKSQAESLNTEYDRLAEHSKLQIIVTVASGGDGKKDE